MNALNSYGIKRLVIRDIMGQNFDCSQYHKARKMTETEPCFMLIGLHKKKIGVKKTKTKQEDK